MRGLLAILLISGCGNGGSSHDAGTTDGGGSANDSGATDSGTDANEGMGFRVGGNALGMREPTRVTLQVNGAQTYELVVTEDGTFRFPRRFPSGTTYVATTANTRCRVVAGTGTVTAEVTDVALYCIGVVELAPPIVFTPAVITLSPTFQSAELVYSGARPYFSDASDLISATPIARYPTESTIYVYDVATPSGQASTPHAYGSQITVMVDHGATDLTQTYTFNPSPLPRFESYIKASDPAVNASLGSSMVAPLCGETSATSNGVALSGDTLVVGAPCAAGGGAVYVYVRTGTSWGAAKKLVASNANVGDLFGASVAIDGDTIVVGAPFEDSDNQNTPASNASSASGAIYVFKRGTNNWSDPPTYLKATSIADGAQFGSSVATDGTTLVAGAPFESNGGTAYVFTFGTAWTLQQSFRGSATATGHTFAASVSLSGDRIAAGAPREGTEAGATYVFSRSGTTWSQQGRLVASNAAAGDRFGWAVSLDGTYVAIGAPNEDGLLGPNDNSALNAGAVYVFEWSGSTWGEQAYLKPQFPRGSDQFGISVALARNALVAGAWSEDSRDTIIDADPTPFDGTNVGAAYVFRRTSASPITWGDRHYVKAINAQDGDAFGASVGADGDTFAVAAPGEDSGMIGNMMDETASAAGAVYVFR